MKRIALVGARFRGWKNSLPFNQQDGAPADRAHLMERLTKFKADNPAIEVLTLSCDICFGRQVWECCDALNIPALEVSCRGNRLIQPAALELYHCARYAMVIDAADYIGVYLSTTRTAGIEDLVARLSIRSPGVFVPSYTIYGPDLEVVEEYVSAGRS